jgi:hypothetical protein
MLSSGPTHCETCGAILISGRFCEAHEPSNHQPVEIPCPICGGSTEVEYASTGTSIECIDGEGCHALTVMPCFPEEAEHCIRAWAGRAPHETVVRERTIFEFDLPRDWERKRKELFA